MILLQLICINEWIKIKYLMCDLCHEAEQMQRDSVCVCACVLYCVSGGRFHWMTRRALRTRFWARARAHTHTLCHRHWREWPDARAPVSLDDVRMGWHNKKLNISVDVMKDIGMKSERYTTRNYFRKQIDYSENSSFILSTSAPGQRTKNIKDRNVVKM